MFAFLFKKKTDFIKKTVSLSHSASKYMYTHVYFVHIYEYIYAQILFIWILRALQVSHPDTWAIITPRAGCVCTPG